MAAQASYERIAEDMQSIWGDIALPLLRKRLRDVQAAPNALTQTDLEKIVELLRAKTLPSILGDDASDAKAKQDRA